jgi:hypothetical protein
MSAPEENAPEARWEIREVKELLGKTGIITEIIE